jgi:hypothetical protein
LSALASATEGELHPSPSVITCQWRDCPQISARTLVELARRNPMKTACPNFSALALVDLEEKRAGTRQIFSGATS